MKNLPSNEFWGKRSGAITDQGPVFRQRQWSSGASRQGKQKTCKLTNVNHKWFK